MGTTLKVKYKFGVWQILLKKPFYLNISFPIYEIWAENNKIVHVIIPLCSIRSIFALK